MNRLGLPTACPIPSLIPLRRRMPTTFPFSRYIGLPLAPGQAALSKIISLGPRASIISLYPETVPIDVRGMTDLSGNPVNAIGIPSGWDEVSRTTGTALCSVSLSCCELLHTAISNSLLLLHCFGAKRKKSTSKLGVSVRQPDLGRYTAAI